MIRWLLDQHHRLDRWVHSHAWRWASLTGVFFFGFGWLVFGHLWVGLMWGVMWFSLQLAQYAGPTRRPRRRSSPR